MANRTGNTVTRSAAEPAEPRGLVERLACKFCRELVEADPHVLALHLSRCRLAPAEVRRAWRPTP